jgi:hypothetical protein
MSLAMAAAGPGNLIFAADSKLRYVDSTDTIQTSMASKIAVYRLRKGNVVVAQTGMWIEGGADNLLHDGLRSWAESAKAPGQLCQWLATDVAQALIQQAFREGTPNLSEFLLGFFLSEEAPSLFCVSSAHYEMVPYHLIRAIGGDPRSPFTQTYACDDWEELDAIY